MQIIFLILLISLATWSIVYEFFYSPKAQIKKLWGEIFNISFKIAEQKKLNYDSNPLVNIYENVINKKKAMINALLDYYFNTEEDEEYVKENKP